MVGDAHPTKIALLQLVQDVIHIVRAGLPRPYSYIVVTNFNPAASQILLAKP